MGRSRYKITENSVPYFHTSTIVGWLPIFTRPETVQMILDSWEYLQEHENFVLHGYVILENHIHFIANSDNHSEHIMRFKSFTARKIIDYLEEQGVAMFLKQLEFYKVKHKTDRQYQFWQEGTHPKQMLNEEMMRQKLDYIHYNPVKRGYVDEPVHWRYSSARNYAGQEGLVSVCCAW
jgi:REP element-mobilizing transposase RayT